MNIIQTITDWPVIIQGALGSALFWAILEFGQRGTKGIAARLSDDKKTANWFALAAHEAAPQVAVEARFFCFYGALHYIVKALIVAVLSWAVSPLLDIVASAGYLISAYFLFRALAFVPHTKSLGTSDERKKRFKESLVQLLTQSSVVVTGSKPKNEP
jgi:hypothetical protein